MEGKVTLKNFFGLKQYAKYRRFEIMTMVPEWKTCPKCRKKYSWNPDVGQFKCPHCGGLGKKNGILPKLFMGSKKKDK